MPRDFSSPQAKAHLYSKILGHRHLVSILENVFSSYVAFARNTKRKNKMVPRNGYWGKSITFGPIYQRFYQIEPV